MYHHVQNYLIDIGINTIVWAARSPDLNPIDHIWDILGERLRDHSNRLNNLEDVLIWENKSNKMQNKLKCIPNIRPPLCVAWIKFKQVN